MNECNEIKRINAELDEEKAITTAIKKAIRKALLFHKQTGHPIYVWENGQVVRREAKDINIDLI